MTKRWSLLCFLVLAASVLCSGNNDPTVRTEDEPANGSTEAPESHVQTPDPLPAPTPAPAPAPTPAPAPGPEEPDTNLEEYNGDFNASTTNQTETSEIPSTIEAETTEDDLNENLNVSSHQTTPAVVMTTRGRGRHLDVTVTTGSSSKSPAAGGGGGGGGSSSWGYVLLVLIILVIVILCFILYLLRRASRTYSFDLQRPAPVHRLDEPIGTFEPVYLDDLDPPAPKDHVTTEDPPPPPTANGTTPPSGEKTSNGEIGNQDPPEVNEKPLTSATCPSESDDPAVDKTSGTLSDSSLFFDAAGDEQQNENNNNPSVCSSDPFVEINLDDPAWCDQLLSSAAAPSSVLPFSPFSFSPSSSSS